MALSLIVVLAMIASGFFITPVKADDQAKSRISAGPSVRPEWTLQDVEWEENGHYAIAVGQNTTSGNGIIERLNPDGSWTELYTATGATFYDVVADMNAANTFYAVGADGTKALAYMIIDAGGSATVQDINPSILGNAQAFYGACFDKYNDYLVAVGTDTTTNGLIAYYDFSNWHSDTTAPSDVLEAVTWDYSGKILAVGHNGGAAIAYSYDYSTPSLIPAPPDAAAFHGIDWQPWLDYALVVGEDTNGYGGVWKLVYDNSSGYFVFSPPLGGITAGTPPLNDVDWDSGGGGAVIVGNSGAVYIHYAWQDRVVDWTDPSFTSNIYGVSVKSPGSPGYGLGVGVSSAPVVSYQVSDSSTEITVDTVYPHLNEIDFRDFSGASKLNQQVDVGSTYYFYINASYSQGWDKVNMDIYAWYDNGDDTTNYNDTQGANLNFKLHYVPDTTDPVNNSGIWTLVYPTTGEVTLENWNDVCVDGTAYGIFHLYVNITLGPQIRYAPGDGTWNNATDQYNRTSSLNDINSWNFNVTVYDSSLTTARQTRYDEFGVFAYTEVGASQNPSGAGPPGSTITLNPESQVAIRANRNYYVTVNVTDLKNATGAETIPRANIEVINSHGDASGNSDISAWTAFSGSGPLWLWGVSAGPTYMPPMDNGTCTAGLSSGYDTSTTYTPVSWRVNVPPTTPEDHFTATITYEISYP